MRPLGNRGWTAEQTMGLSGVLGNVGSSSQEGYPRTGLLSPLMAQFRPPEPSLSLIPSLFFPNSYFFGLFSLPFPVFKISVTIPGTFAADLGVLF